MIPALDDDRSPRTSGPMVIGLWNAAADRLEELRLAGASIDELEEHAALELTRLLDAEENSEP